MSECGPLWHVAYVEPRLDRQACSDITDDLGFEVYVPAERLWRVVRGRRIIVQKPLFPRYIFVGIDLEQPWQEVLDVRGVINILGRSDDDTCRPIDVSSIWITAMRKAEACGAFDQTTVESCYFKIGERVRISDGPFSGFYARIEKFMTDRKRARTVQKKAKVIMDFMNQITQVELPLTQLEKA